MKLRSLIVGSSLLATGTVIGVATQQFANADVSSGDRPVLVPIETCRLADTRPAPNTVGPRSAPLATADTHTIDAQQAGTDCTGKIPAGATALSLNVTALNATSNSFLTIWPDGERPVASALNPAPGVRVFNAVTTELAADQTFQVYNNRGNLDVFIDVNGYYENHNHDDSYYTRAEVDSIALRPFAIEGDSSTIDIVSTDLVSPSLASTLTVPVPGPGQLVVTATGNYSAILSGGNFPNVQCSLTDTGEFDSDHRSLYQVWNATPTGSNERSQSDLAITRVIDVDTAGDVTLEILCRRNSGPRVLAVSRIIAQYIP